MSNKTPSFNKGTSDDKDGWNRVLRTIEDETHRRMQHAKKRLEELMQAGEINELDKRIVRKNVLSSLSSLFRGVIVF